MAPFGEERLIGSAAREVPADGHGTESAAVVALAARNDTVLFWRTAFEMKLAREFDGRFAGFGTAGSEVDAAIGEIGRSEGEKPRGELFGGRRMELCRVGKGDLGGLFSHGFGDFFDAVTDADNSGLPGSVEILLTVGGENPRALATHDDRKRFLEVARKEGGVGGHGKAKCSREPERAAAVARVGSAQHAILTTPVLEPNWMVISPRQSKNEELRDGVRELG